VTYPWTSGPVLATLLLGVAVFAVFLLWEAKIPTIPIIPGQSHRTDNICFADPVQCTSFSIEQSSASVSTR
jgi:hypothetical protein